MICTSSGRQITSYTPIILHVPGERAGMETANYPPRKICNPQCMVKCIHMNKITGRLDITCINIVSYNFNLAFS